MIVENERMASGARCCSPARVCSGTVSVTRQMLSEILPACTTTGSRILQALPDQAEGHAMLNVDNVRGSL